ncbi:MAG: phospholipid carrier-dependent glycosyltransferase [bacterium]|nr:phospholipid carrier-dependent glycosyltransferase [bacterium]
MDIPTVLLFFVYIWGLGVSATLFVKEAENQLERNLMRFGFGIALFIVLGLFLNLIHVPLDWKIFLVLSLLGPIYKVIRKKPKLHVLKLTRSNLSIMIVLIIFLASLFMYVSGAAKYPYLEDDDPWSHAMGVSYVAHEKTVFDTPEKTDRIHYIDPYPPSYDMILGVLHQTSSSINWTLKFFNALIISLGLIFFYFFAKEFTQNKALALFATFVLASVPAFLSHFIWALSLIMPLFFVGFYALERIKHDKRWWIVAAIVTGAALVVAPSHSAYYGLFFALYFIVRTILERKFLLYEFLAGVCGLALSLLWWGQSFLKFGITGTLDKIGIGGQSILGVAGTGDRVYTFVDFFIAQKQNMINSPVGLGIFVCLLGFIGIIYAIIRIIYAVIKHNQLLKKNHWIIITFVWLALTMYAVNAANMPIKLSPFRVWMLLAVPVSLIASLGLIGLWRLVESLLKSAYSKDMDKDALQGMKTVISVIKIAILVIVVVGVLFTSTQQKYAVNTAQWPPGAMWTSYQEVEAYSWLSTLPIDTKVFSFSHDSHVIGFDKFSCGWCEDVLEFRRTAINQSAEDIYVWLSSNGYEYTILGGMEIRTYGEEPVMNLIQQMDNSSHFQPAHSVQGGALIFKVV